MQYVKKPKLVNPVRRCKCGNVGTVPRSGSDIACDRCAEIEADLHDNVNSFVPRENQRGRSTSFLETHAVNLGARGHQHLAFDLEVVAVELVEVAR